MIKYLPPLVCSNLPAQGIFLNQENIVKKSIVHLLMLATALVLMLAACAPAEQVVDPAELATVEAGTEEKPAEVLDAVFPPVEETVPISMENATVTETGLQFFEMQPGEGPTPQDGDLVTMNFVASLPDGTEFANSYLQGAPATAIIGSDQLLPGWEEGVKMMTAGSKARMVLPPELAFGEEGYGMIPPNSEIVLVIDIISISAPPTPSKISVSDLTTTDSGLQYYDIEVGTGTEAVVGFSVSTHFSIWVQGEAEDRFIGSSNDGQPISFEIGRGDSVFPGWEEGVVGMKVGGERYLLIPAELGFGDTGAGDIPANATLIMEIKLTEANEPVQQTEVDPADYIETESGLKYFDIVEGDGPAPEPGQSVVVHYSGWLEDGTKFDSSLDRGQPFSFAIGTGSVIPGWDEGVATMKAGGKRQLYIPADLGYGEAGSGIIPPGATLIFDVELLEIQE
jgi:peptidylprolyl isomerase